MTNNQPFQRDARQAISELLTPAYQSTANIDCIELLQDLWQRADSSHAPLLDILPNLNMTPSESLKREAAELFERVFPTSLEVVPAPVTAVLKAMQDARISPEIVTATLHSLSHISNRHSLLPLCTNLAIPFITSSCSSPEIAVMLPGLIELAITATPQNEPISIAYDLCQLGHTLVELGLTSVPGNLAQYLIARQAGSFTKVPLVPALNAVLQAKGADSLTAAQFSQTVKIAELFTQDTLTAAIDDYSRGALSTLARVQKKSLTPELAAQALEDIQKLDDDMSNGVVASYVIKFGYSPVISALNHSISPDEHAYLCELISAIHKQARSSDNLRTFVAPALFSLRGALNYAELLTLLAPDMATFKGYSRILQFLDSFVKPVPYIFSTEVAKQLERLRRLSAQADGTSALEFAIRTINSAEPPRPATFELGPNQHLEDAPVNPLANQEAFWSLVELHKSFTWEFRATVLPRLVASITPNTAVDTLTNLTLTANINGILLSDLSRQDACKVILHNLPADRPLTRDSLASFHKNCMLFSAAAAALSTDFISSFQRAKLFVNVFKPKEFRAAAGIALSYTPSRSPERAGPFFDKYLAPWLQNREGPVTLEEFSNQAALFNRIELLPYSDEFKTSLATKDYPRARENIDWALSTAERVLPIDRLSFTEAILSCIEAARSEEGESRVKTYIDQLMQNEQWHNVKLLAQLSNLGELAEDEREMSTLRRALEAFTGTSLGTTTEARI